MFVFVLDEYTYDSVNKDTQIRDTYAPHLPHMSVQPVVLMTDHIPRNCLAEFKGGACLAEFNDGVC